MHLFNARTVQKAIICIQLIESVKKIIIIIWLVQIYRYPSFNKHTHTHLTHCSNSRKAKNCSEREKTLASVNSEKQKASRKEENLCFLLTVYITQHQFLSRNAELAKNAFSSNSEFDLWSRVSWLKVKFSQKPSDHILYLILSTYFFCELKFNWVQFNIKL